MVAVRMTFRSAVWVAVSLGIGCGSSGGQLSNGGPADAGGGPADAGVANADAGLSDTLSSADTPLSMDQAFADFATAQCNHASSCSAFWAQVDYGTVSACVSSGTAFCKTLSSMPGVMLSPGVLEQCAISMGTAPCSIAPNVVPTGCDLRGSLANNTACTHDAQCASGYCECSGPWCFPQGSTGSIEAYADCTGLGGGSCRPSTTCGFCADRITAGHQLCISDYDCAPGLECDGTNTCVTPLPLGSACSASTLCAWPLGCIGGTCSQGGALGAACDSLQNPCDLSQGLYCGVGNTCQTMSIVGAGQACDNVRNVCQLGTYCNYHSGPGGAVTTCKTEAADGQSCALEMDGCVWPDTCASSTGSAPLPASCR